MYPCVKIYFAFIYRECLGSAQLAQPAEYEALREGMGTQAVLLASNA